LESASHQDDLEEAAAELDAVLSDFAASGDDDNDEGEADALAFPS
jgi:hypothetical protein